MKISKEILDLAEKIRDYRKDLKATEELKLENKSLEDRLNALENALKTYSSKAIEEQKLFDKIKDLELQIQKLIKENENIRKIFTFVVTTPSDASNTVYGEISREIYNAKREILISSPWITYLIDDLEKLLKKSKKNEISVKVITRLDEEDIKRGITDIDKLRILIEDIGAQVRYNNNLHAKLVIIDGIVAVISSANMTKGGLLENYEAGIVLKDKEIAEKVRIFFENIWLESKNIDTETIKKLA